MTRIALATVALALCANLAGEGSLRIAVASNFHTTLSKIAERYEESHPETKVTLIPGSSGKLYAQIANGAAYHAFFSADSDRPLELEQDGLAAAGSRFTFALGILVLWQPDCDKLGFANAKTLAIANPKLAPFGRAAKEALDSLQIHKDDPRRVLAASVSQAYAYAQSGAADSALVSYSQLLEKEVPAEQFTVLDSALYTPIDQQAIALSNDAETLNFLRFCQSDAARTLILAAGYHLPE